jgi:hypothetical protein
VEGRSDYTWRDAGKNQLFWRLGHGLLSVVWEECAFSTYSLESEGSGEESSDHVARTKGAVVD